MNGPFNIKDLGSVLEMLSKHDVTEFKWERDNEKLSLRRGKEIPVSREVTSRVQHTATSSPISPTAVVPSNVIPLVNVHSQGAPQLQAVHSALPPSGVSAAAELAPIQAVTSAQEAPVRKNLKEITSPMVGTFYRRPAVDAKPFVEVGDMVKKGDVLCIVEAMKLMNEIESDVVGKVAEVCLEDGRMVEYGEVLFRLEPV